MAASATAAQTVQSQTLTGADLVQYIVQRSTQLGLDPVAVLSVAKREGSFQGAVGDSGTSFGPFQLHGGNSTSDPTSRGALPQSVWSQGPSYAQNWANSQAGVDYALSRISQVARGLTGAAAISNIVSRFEHPSQPGPEISDAIGYYNSTKASLNTGDYAAVATSSGGGGALSQIGKGFGAAVNAVDPFGNPVNIIGSAGKTVSGVEAVGSFLGKLSDPNFWLRALQVIGGGILAFAGLFLLARQVALAIDAPDPIRAVAAAAPAVAR